MTDTQVGIVGQNHKILTGALKKRKTIISANLLIAHARWQMQNYGRVKRNNPLLSQAYLSYPFSKNQANK